jgi:hypothetical protein
MRTVKVELLEGEAEHAGFAIATVAKLLDRQGQKTKAAEFWGTAAIFADAMGDTRTAELCRQNATQLAEAAQ